MPAPRRKYEDKSWLRGFNDASCSSSSLRHDGTAEGLARRAHRPAQGDGSQPARRCPQHYDDPPATSARNTQDDGRAGHRRQGPVPEDRPGVRSEPGSSPTTGWHAVCSSSASTNSSAGLSHPTNFVSTAYNVRIPSSGSSAHARASTGPGAYVSRPGSSAPTAVALPTRRAAPDVPPSCSATAASTGASGACNKSGDSCCNDGRAATGYSAHRADDARPACADTARGARNVRRTPQAIWHSIVDVLGHAAATRRRWPRFA